MSAARWRPLGASYAFGFPDIGTLIAFDHGVYRVREINPIPKVDLSEEDREALPSYGAPKVVVVRPAHLTGDDPKLYRKDVHLQANRLTQWWTYPNDHYPVCVQCGEPLPCREREIVEEGERSAAFMARYELAGVCPACLQPVTQRQGSRTFDENLYMPGGPPVTFHASRRECWDGLVRYEDKWVAADPDNRLRHYHCDGIVTAHGPDAYECTQGADCPGPQASHKALQGCRCHRNQGRSYRLSKTARNLALPPVGYRVDLDCVQHPTGDPQGGENR